MTQAPAQGSGQRPGPGGGERRWQCRRGSAARLGHRGGLHGNAGAEVYAQVDVDDDGQYLQTCAIKLTPLWTSHGPCHICAQRGDVPGPPPCKPAGRLPQLLRRAEAVHGGRGNGPGTWL